jgi:hypothetical protein
MGVIFAQLGRGGRRRMSSSSSSQEREDEPLVGMVGINGRHMKNLF